MKTLFTLLFSAMIAINVINAQQQVHNPGFEEWEDVGLGLEEPVNWSSIKTSDNFTNNIAAPVVWSRSSDAHSGNYSLSLFTVGSLVVANGTITNGRIHSQLPANLSYAYTDVDSVQWHGLLTDRPDSIAGWYKCNPAAGDFGTVKFLLHTGYAQLPGNETDNIAIASYELPGEEITQWTRFSAPFIYSSDDNPEYFLSVLTSGNALQTVIGSTALYDDLEFIYNGSSVDELSENKLEVIVNNQQIQFVINDNSNKEYEIMLMDINGRTVLKNKFAARENNTFNISDLQPGIYIAVANNSQKSFTKKVLIR